MSGCNLQTKGGVEAVSRQNVILSVFVNYLTVSVFKTENYGKHFQLHEYPFYYKNINIVIVGQLVREFNIFSAVNLIALTPG